jgi:pentatricopeptide repeat protein
MMERNGVVADRYTLSIMMKALKKVRDPSDIDKTMSLLDRSGLDVFSDEVLLNSVLEACIKHRKLDRISLTISAFFQSSLRVSAATYGSLIKASSALKSLDKCWKLWQDMTERRAMQPNIIVLGCMLNALVSNNGIDDAVKLFRDWSSRIPPNEILYCTLIKGFANSRRPAEAMELWGEMQKKWLVDEHCCVQCSYRLPGTQW